MHWRSVPVYPANDLLPEPVLVRIRLRDILPVQIAWEGIVGGRIVAYARDLQGNLIPIRVIWFQLWRTGYRFWLQRRGYMYFDGATLFQED